MNNESKELSRQERFSRFLSDKIDSLSNFLSRYRGIPMFAAVFFIILNIVLILLNALVQERIPLLSCLVSTNCFLHFGLIVGFVGILLAEPLGRG